ARRLPPLARGPHLLPQVRSHLHPRPRLRPCHQPPFPQRIPPPPPNAPQSRHARPLHRPPHYPLRNQRRSRHQPPHPQAGPPPQTQPHPPPPPPQQPHPTK